MVDWMASKVVSRRVAFSLRAGEEPRDGHHRVTTNDELPEGSSVGRQVLPSYSGPIIDAGSAALPNQPGIFVDGMTELTACTRRSN